MANTYIPHPATNPQSHLKKCLAAALILSACVLASRAASVSLAQSDGGGTTSFNTAGHWSNAAAPGPGNTYSVGNAITLRTPAPTISGNNYIFLGDSLSIDSGARLLGKMGSNTASSTVSGTITVTNFIFNGGAVDQADGNNDNTTLIVAGNINVNAASVVGAIGGTGNGSASFDTIEFTAVISGAAPWQASGPSINGGQDTGVVRLSAANPYSGTLSVSNGNSGVIASAVNRILQLNHLNALSNATLNLDSSPASPVSFASGVNTGPFNVGALTGKASQTLTDTAGSPVILSVGGNNHSSTYNGGLTDAGTLVKVGTGTLTLAGTNTFTGNTLVSSGTLALAATGSLSNSPVLAMADGATFDVSANNFAVAAGQSLTGSGTVQGSVNTLSGAKIFAGNDGTCGTNTFAANLTLAAGAQVCLDLSAQYNGSNDLIVVGGSLALAGTTFRLKAFDTSANLDVTTDYILMTAANGITGSLSATPTWDSPPLNAANYSIVQSGNSIKLHYTVSAPPTGSGSANPDTVTRNQNTLVTVTVASSSHPVSAVTLDASAIGGSASLPLTAAGGGTYTGTVSPGASITLGAKTLLATITDNSGLSGTTPAFTLTVIAANETWSGAGPNDHWSSNPNWTSGAAPGYVGDTLTFTGTARLTPNMETNYSITDITFDGSAGSFAIGTTGGTLTVTGGGIVNNSANAQVLNVPIITAAPAAFTTAAGNLTLGQSITNAGNVVSVGGSGNTIVNSGIADPGGLVKNDSGTLILNGTNTYTGGTAIYGGTVQLAGAGLLGGGNYAGNITNAGIFQYSSSAAQTISGVISQNGLLIDGPGTLTLSGANTFTTDTLINSGVLQIAGSGSLGGGTYAGNLTDNGSFEFSSSAAQTLTGVISGTGSVLQDGPGTLTLSGPNTCTGTTTVTAGTLVFNPVTMSYPAINILSVTNAALTINASSSSSLPVSRLTLDNNSILNLNYDFTAGNPTVAAVAVATSCSVPGSSITINVSGLGALVGQFPLLSYPGAPLPNLDNFILGSLPPGLTASLANNAANHSIDLNVTADVPATWIALTAVDQFGLSSFNTGDNWAGSNPPDNANGYYTKAYVLRSPADTNSYAFAGKVLSIDSGGRFLLKGTGGQVLTISNLILDGGVMDIAVSTSDNFTETVAGGITVQSGLTSYLGALGSGGSAETLIVTAPISGGGNLQIGGPLVNVGQDVGTVILTGTNSYTGSTTVTTGTLLVNGPLINSSVTVNSNATLGGFGAIGGTVTVQPGGKLAPGISARGALTASLGTLTTASPATLGGAVQMRIDRAAATNSDRLVAPSVIVSPGAVLAVSNLGSASLAAGDTFALFSAPVSGAFSSLTLPSLPGTNVYWTNNLAVNGTIAVVPVVTVNPTSTNLSISISAGNFSLTWPADHIGWTLQVQTNSLAAGLGSTWLDVPGSVATNLVIIPIHPTGAVFYRLKL